MWSRALSELARGVARLIYPNTCLVCDAPEVSPDDFRHGLCKDCLRSVTNDPFPACPWCAATVGLHTDTRDGCGACRGASLGVRGVIRLGPYNGRLRDAVLRMKSAGGEGLAELMGRVFWEAACDRLGTMGVDVVVPVPLHWWRRWGRGFNQSAAVARELASGLNVPCVSGFLRRVRYTPQQVQPTASARRENVRGAFRAKSRASLAARTVLLVDDVMTTGSTLGEAARVLQEQAGAARVVGAVLARQ